MNRHLSARIGAAVAAGAFLAVSFAGPASAAEPAEPPCLGEFMSGGAQSGGMQFGQDISTFARYGSEIFGIQNLGEGIQALQAGEAPSFPWVCNSDWTP